MLALEFDREVLRLCWLGVLLASLPARRARPSGTASMSEASAPLSVSTLMTAVWPSRCAR